MSEESTPIQENPAVARCYSEWQRVYRAEKDKGEFWTDAAKAANRAYRKVMPSLSGQENIRNFVACVAHGMLLGAIEGKDGTKLLYAAQVALSTVRGKSAPAQASAA
jgi:broad specificity phosphatase PhoE